MRIYLFVLLTMSFMVVSCTSIEKKDANFRVVATDAIKYAKMNFEEIANDNDQSIRKGKDDNLDFFAPETFKRTLYYRDKVKKNIQKEQNRAEIIRESELVKKYLLESYAVKETISLEMKDILEVNQFLRKLNAAETYKNEFNSFQKKISEMVQLYDEKRSPDAFKDRAALLAEMQKIEAQATIDMILAPARNIFADMKERSLEKIAPLSLREAQDVYNSSEKSIWKDCRDQENLTRVGEKSLFWAKRARNISEETLRLKELKKEEFESIVLDEEKRLHSIDNALGTDDFRNLRLIDHAAALVKAAKERTTVAAAATVPLKPLAEEVKDNSPLPQKSAAEAAAAPEKSPLDPAKMSGQLIQELTTEPTALPAVPANGTPESAEKINSGKEPVKN